MHPKEIRRSVLEILYESRADFMVNTEELVESLKQKGMELDERTLHGELNYLDEKGFIKKVGSFNQKYLNFIGLGITAYGVDLVEDPEEFSKLFSIKINHFGDISNSNVNIDSPRAEQELSVMLSESPELQNKLLELREMINAKDSKKTLSILTELSEGSKAVFWNVVSSFVMSMPNL